MIHTKDCPDRTEKCKRDCKVIDTDTGGWFVDDSDPENLGVAEDHHLGSMICELGPKCPRTLRHAFLIAVTPELLQAAKNALADLEGIMPDFEPSGDRTHSAWKTITELRAIIEKTKVKDI